MSLASWLELGRCARDRVVVAERSHVEGLRDRHPEGRQRVVEQRRRRKGAGVAKLPEAPQTVDHRVVGPEDRVERSEWNLAHVTSDPDVHAIVKFLGGLGEVEEVSLRERLLDVVVARQLRWV